jgi:protein-tyrosine phosphatase
MPTPAQWLPFTIGSGRLAIAARPRGGEWLRDEITHWRNAGATIVASMLEIREMTHLGLTEEPSACAEAGIDYLSHPIRDVTVPPDISAAHGFITQLHTRIRDGASAIIHCRMGIGRSSTIAASVLAHEGIAPANAFTFLAAARGWHVPDTDEQRRWVEDYFATYGRKT